MSSRFYFGDSGSDSDNELDNDTSTLPFPKPLAREAFLTPDFNPTEFLSNLSTRFQTLEDLQTELRELSQSLSKELIDLVNDNYQDFLTLGATLRGGDEKIEDIRVGLLGFQSDVSGLKAKIDERRNEVQHLMEEKRTIMKEAEVARGLMEVEERLSELEGLLGLAEGKNQDQDQAYSGSEDEEDIDDEAGGVSKKPKRRVEQYLILKLLISQHGAEHPFLRAQQSRVDRVKATLLLDVDAMMKQAQNDHGRQELLRLRQMVGQH